MLAYQLPIALLFVGTHALVVALLSAAVYRRATGWRRYSAAGLLVPWLAVVVAVHDQPWLRDFSGLLPALALVMSVPLGVGLALLLRARWLHEVVRALPVELLVGVQVYRVIGVVFLLGWLGGELPVALGLPTGVLDVTIGLTAPLAAYFYVRRGQRAPLLAWNVVGLLDFGYSVTLGLVTLPTLFNLLTLTPSPVLLAQPPLSLIVLWAVPFSILLHAAVLLKVLRPAGAGGA